MKRGSCFLSLLFIWLAESYNNEAEASKLSGQELAFALEPKRGAEEPATERSGDLAATAAVPASASEDDHPPNEKQMKVKGSAHQPGGSRRLPSQRQSSHHESDNAETPAHSPSENKASGHSGKGATQRSFDENPLDNDTQHALSEGLPVESLNTMQVLQATASQTQGSTDPSTQEESETRVAKTCADLPCGEGQMTCKGPSVGGYFACTCVLGYMLYRDLETQPRCVVLEQLDASKNKVDYPADESSTMQKWAIGWMVFGSLFIIFLLCLLVWACVSLHNFANSDRSRSVREEFVLLLHDEGKSDGEELRSRRERFIFGVNGQDNPHLTREELDEQML